MTSGRPIRVFKALTSQALEARGGWTVAFGGDLALEMSWPAAVGYGNGTTTLTNTGTAFVSQRTTGISPSGIGSARANKAVRGGTGVAFNDGGASGPSTLSTIPANAIVNLRFVADMVTNPTTQRSMIGQIVDATQTVGASVLDPGATSPAAVDTTDGDFFDVVNTTPGPTVNIQVASAGNLLSDRPSITDITFDPVAGEYLLYINGVDLTPIITPLLVGETLDAFTTASQPAISLLATTAGTLSSVDSKMVVAAFGIGASRLVTLDEHRADADSLGLREDGFAIDQLGEWTRAWHFRDTENRGSEDAPRYYVPAFEDAGGTSADLAVSGGDISLDLSTDEVRREGLGLSRTEHAIAPTDTTTLIRVGAGTPVIDGDFHIRLVFKVSDSPTADQDLFFLEDPDNPALQLSVTVGGVNPDDLVVRMTTGYTRTFTNAVSFNRWNLLDVHVDRNGGGGGESLMVVVLNGTDLSATQHTSGIADIPVGSGIALFGDAALTNGAATSTKMAFAGLALDRILPPGRSLLDAAALGLL